MIVRDRTPKSMSLGPTYSFISYQDFDPNTGAINYSTMPNDDELTEISLTADGTGSIFDVRHFNNSALVFAQISFDVLSWEVDGLPEIAPVPLPASLPLLGVGMAAMGFVTRRRKAAGRS